MEASTGDRALLASCRLRTPIVTLTQYLPLNICCAASPHMLPFVGLVLMTVGKDGKRRSGSAAVEYNKFVCVCEHERESVCELTVSAWRRARVVCEPTVVVVFFTFSTARTR